MISLVYWRAGPIAGLQRLPDNETSQIQLQSWTLIGKFANEFFASSKRERARDFEENNSVSHRTTRQS
jgi:hypothetical protein